MFCRRFFYLLLVNAGLSYPVSGWAKTNEKIKVFDQPGARASCPEGYRELGRFAEMSKSTPKKIQGGVECQIDKSGSQKSAKQQERSRGAFPLPPADKNLPNELTLEEKDGKPPKCPDGYQQTGTFNNMTFVNGKMDKKSGIYCMRRNDGKGAPSQESAPEEML